MKLIKHTSWASIADYYFDPGVNPSAELPTKPCIIYCPLDHIHTLFNKLDRNPVECTLISANSDYGLVKNHQNLVSNDMIKWIQFPDGKNITGYQPLILPPRCNIENCKITDDMAIKMYSWTNATINHIPNCVKKWYCTNSLLSSPRIINIPFGVPEWSYDFILKAREENHPKTKLIFASFSINTLERYKVASYLENIGIPVLNGLSHEDYIKELNRSQYCITIPGNGFDCFRNLEAIYLGTKLLMPLVSDDNNLYSLFENLYKEYLEVVQMNTISDMPSIPKMEDSHIFDLDYITSQICS